MANRIAVILNPASGSQLPAEQLGLMFHERGLYPHIFQASAGEDLTALTRDAIERGYSLIVAAGGDGTVRSAAIAALNTNATLGILPLGTLNHLSKDLGIPQSPREALQVIADGEPMRIDIGEVNGQIFINTSSLGIYTRIVEQRERQRAKFGRSKWLALTLATVSAFWNFVWHRMRITADHRDLRRYTPFVLVSNNVYELEGVKLGMRPTLCAARLGLLVASPKSRWGIVGLAIRMLFKRIQGAKQVESISCREVQVRLRRKHVPVALDGEVVVLDTPLNYSIRPQALSVMVPHDATVQLQKR